MSKGFTNFQATLYMFSVVFKRKTFENISGHFNEMLLKELTHSSTVSQLQSTFCQRFKSEYRCRYLHHYTDSVSGIALHP